MPKTPEEETQLIAIAQDAFMAGACGFMGGIKGVLTAVGLLPVRTTAPICKTFRQCTRDQAIHYATAGHSVKCRWGGGGGGGWVTFTRADASGARHWGSGWVFRVAVANKKVCVGKADRPCKTVKCGVRRALTHKEATDLLLHNTPVEARLAGGNWVRLSPKANDISQWSSNWMFRRVAAKRKATKDLTREQAGALLRGGVSIRGKLGTGAWISILPEPDANVLNWGSGWKFRKVKSDHKPASKN